MSTTLETIHEDIRVIKNELAFLRHVMEEEYELGDEARQDLKAARKRLAKGEYIPHEQVMKQYG